MTAKFTSGNYVSTPGPCSPISFVNIIFFFPFSFGNNIGTEPNPVYDVKAVSIGATNVTLAWANNVSVASLYEYEVKNTMDSRQLNLSVNQTRIDILGLSPATVYTFSITPRINGILGNATVISVTTGKVTSSLP